MPGFVAVFGWIECILKAIKALSRADSAIRGTFNVWKEFGFLKALKRNQKHYRSFTLNGLLSIFFFFLGPIFSSFYKTCQGWKVSIDNAVGLKPEHSELIIVTLIAFSIAFIIVVIISCVICKTHMNCYPPVRCKICNKLCWTVFSFEFNKSVCRKCRCSTKYYDQQLHCPNCYSNFNSWESNSDELCKKCSESEDE